MYADHLTMDVCLSSFLLAFVVIVFLEMDASGSFTFIVRIFFINLINLIFCDCSLHYRARISHRVGKDPSPFPLGTKSD